MSQVTLALRKRDDPGARRDGRTSKSALAGSIILLTSLLSACSHPLDPGLINVPQLKSPGEVKAGNPGVLTAQVQVGGGKQGKLYVAIQWRTSGGSWMQWAATAQIDAPASKDFSGSWASGAADYRVAAWNKDPKSGGDPVDTSLPVTIVGWDYASIYKSFVNERKPANAASSAFYAASAKCFPLPNNRGSQDTFSACYQSYRKAFRIYVASEAAFDSQLAQMNAPASLGLLIRDYGSARSADQSQLDYIYTTFCPSQPQTYDDYANCVGATDGSSNQMTWVKESTYADAVTRPRDALAAAFVAMGFPDFAKF